jgi:hypothetical protein
MWHGSRHNWLSARKRCKAHREAVNSAQRIWLAIPHAKRTDHYRRGFHGKALAGGPAPQGRLIRRQETRGAADGRGFPIGRRHYHRNRKIRRGSANFRFHAGSGGHLLSRGDRVIRCAASAQYLHRRERRLVRYLLQLGLSLRLPAEQQDGGEEAKPNTRKMKFTHLQPCANLREDKRRAVGIALNPSCLPREDCSRGEQIFAPAGDDLPHFGKQLLTSRLPLGYNARRR